MSEDENFEALLQLAQDGLPEAMTKVGQLLGKRGEIEAAEEWLLKAAVLNDVAIRQLAHLYFEQGDFANAEVWYRKAAELGYFASMFNLGIVLSKRGDLEGAEQWYRRSAEGGRADAMYNLGVLYKDRGEDGVAEEWYRKSAEQDYESAILALGNIYHERGDDDEALLWYEKAAGLGNATGMYSYGVLLLKLNKVRDAEDWFRRAIDLGDKHSLNGLGQALQNRGDIVGAERWLLRAVEENVEGAVASLAEYRKAVESAPMLDALSFNYLGLERVKTLPNCRGWAMDHVTLLERYCEFPPDFPSWDADAIRSAMIELREYVESPTFDIGELDELPDEIRKLIGTRFPDNVTMLEIECFKVQGVKCVSLLTRHRANGDVHFSASLMVLTKECFWFLGLEVEDEELVGKREGAVAQLILEQNEVIATKTETFDPYDRKWDGLIPIGDDPLTRVRLLIAELRTSLRLSEKITVLEPFDE